MAPSLRNQQPYVPGMGRLFHSPKKKHQGVTNRARVKYIGRDLEISRLQERLRELQDDGSSSPQSGPSTLPLDDEDTPIGTLNEPPELTSSDVAPDAAAGQVDPPESLVPPPKRRRTKHTTDVASMYDRWKVLVPTIVVPLLRYLRHSAGYPVATHFVPTYTCATGICTQKLQNVTLLFWDHYDTQSVPYCDCNPLPHVLIASGMFPTSLTQPQMAVAIDLLEFYIALVERSGDAVTALARSLRNFYTRRGWRVLDGKGAPLLDPFRKPLGHAIQWYDIVRVLIDRTLDDVVENARLIIATHISPLPPAVLDNLQSTAPDPETVQLPSSSQPPVLPEPTPAVATSSSISHHPASPDPIAAAVTSPSSSHHLISLQPIAAAATSPSSSHHPASPQPIPATLPEPHEGPTQSQSGQCASLLQRRCPACFGDTKWGRPFAEGGDIVVAIDGNFSHRHMRHIGDSPSFYDPEYFISKAKVDGVGARIEALRKTPPNKNYVPKVPDEAIDSCEHGHEAADEQKAKTNGERFDDTGVMALVCTHDIPIFLMNIDTPGEQLKYSMAALEELFENIPEDATVACLYDIGCVADRGNARYSYLPECIASQLIWAITVMHAYGHQWACQLVYNPRLHPGLGLRNGEGVECLWSRLRIFIPITWTSGRSQRIWLIDRQVRAIGDEMRDNLGTFLKILDTINIPEHDLRHEWMLQQQAQLSIRLHAPARLKKEVDVILTLQADIDRVESVLKVVRTQFQEVGSSPESIRIIRKLEKTSNELSQRVDNLYSSINVGDMFPELKGIQADFVWMLILARDIKINIRKRVTAQFLEYDRLDRAAGGKDNPLGTKLHQLTRKAISKRQPAIQTAIRKFNKYCTMLEELRKQHKLPDTIPLPRPLSTDLAKLRDDPGLFEDVWITALPQEKQPRWLEDLNVRDGIRAILKIDQCNEERIRLYREAENMCEWFGRELAATELAMLTFDNTLYVPLLQQRRDNIALLQRRWDTPLAPPGRLELQALWARKIVQDVLEATHIQTISPTTQDLISSCTTTFEENEDVPSDGFTLVDDIDNPEMIDIVEDVESTEDEPSHEHAPAVATRDDFAHQACTSTGPDARLWQGSVTLDVDVIHDRSSSTDPSAVQDTRHSLDAVSDADQSQGALQDAALVHQHHHQVPIASVAFVAPTQPSHGALIIHYQWTCPSALRMDGFESLKSAQFIGLPTHMPYSRALFHTTFSPSI
ncbi:hypothetical protein OBBRIDRAFT_830617 [Obba rivulosa]|uniref:CxC1-like cysteine cluster associated with KDZ transposases domain-containing protein n=1 Tax=Obba rivulosa TaxID=1052685 RepID=A0A8E2DUQ4_9APHY|nr:hypothetical protein OBBRIDRAFT_830617 [Obba rivulosa]